MHSNVDRGSLELNITSMDASRGFPAAESIVVSGGVTSVGEGEGEGDDDGSGSGVGVGVGGGTMMVPALG